jgi:hypothetical protein
MGMQKTPEVLNHSRWRVKIGIFFIQNRYYIQLIQLPDMPQGAWSMTDPAGVFGKDQSFIIHFPVFKISGYKPLALTRIVRIDQNTISGQKFLNLFPGPG